MSEIIKFLCAVTVVAVVIISSTVLLCRQERQKFYDQGYKDACVDFYKGKLKVDMIKQDDGSVVWQKVEQEQSNVDADHRKQRGKSRPNKN